MWLGSQDSHQHFQTQEKHFPPTVLSEAVAQEALHVRVLLVHVHLSTGGSRQGFMLIMENLASFKFRISAQTHFFPQRSLFVRTSIFSGNM